MTEAIEKSDKEEKYQLYSLEADNNTEWQIAMQQLLGSTGVLKYESKLREAFKYTAALPEDPLVNFDPFRVFPEYRVKAEKYVKEMEVATGREYQLRDSDFDSLIDPLSRELHKNQTGFVHSIRKYLEPYSVAISLAEDQFNRSPNGLNRHHFVLKLGLTTAGSSVTRTLDQRKLTYEDLQNMKDIKEFYYILDNLIDRYEMAVALKTKRIIFAELENAAAKAFIRKNGNGLAVGPEADIFFQKYMHYDEKTRELRLKTDEEMKKSPVAVMNWKPKERKPLLCPDHGSAMMRKKGDDEHLRCTVPGCKRVLKRKTPGLPEELEDSSEPTTPLAETFDNTAKVMKEFSDAIGKAVGTNIAPMNFAVSNPGHLAKEPYTANPDRVYVHQEAGRIWLVQMNTSGLWERIDITQFVRDVRHISQPVYVTSYQSNAPKTVQGPTYIETVLSGMQIA